MLLTVLYRGEIMLPTMVGWFVRLPAARNSGKNATTSSSLNVAIGLRDTVVLPSRRNAPQVAVAAVAAPNTGKCCLGAIEIKGCSGACSSVVTPTLVSRTRDLAAAL